MKIIITIIIILLAHCSYSDQWRDPEFEEMLDSSLAIVLGEVIYGGSEYAEVKILKTFKGDILFDTVYVGGYSNRYGPYDTLRVGEKYYFFFDYRLDSSKFLESIRSNIELDSSLLYFKEKIKIGNYFSVWTPTSGDILIDQNGVHADLVFNRSYKGLRDPIPQNYFEKLLTNRLNKFTDNEFNNIIYNKFEASYLNGQYPILLQYYSLLYLLKYNNYTDLIEEASQDTFYLTRYITAKYLSNVSQNKSREILIELLDDEYPLVQSEAVRQLSKHDSKVIAPILFKKLQDISKEEFTLSQDLMDPVSNYYKSGFMEILSTLAYMEYKKVIPLLKSYLNTNDRYLYENLLDLLEKLDRLEYEKYLVDYLKPDRISYKYLFDVVHRLGEMRSQKGKAAIMEFIEKFGEKGIPVRSKDNSFLVSDEVGLGVFNDPTVSEFLGIDFEKILKDYKKEPNEINTEWIASYINLFSELNRVEYKSEIYGLLNIDSHVNPDSLSNLYKGLNSIYNEVLMLLDTGKGIEGTSIDELYIQSVIFTENPLKEEYPFIIEFYLQSYYVFENLQIEELPDSLQLRYKLLQEHFNDLLKCDKSSISSGIIGIVYNFECFNELKPAIPPLLSETIKFYLSNPDEENYLKFLYLQNKYLKGRYVKEFMELGNTYNLTY